ncbi:MAG: AAA family ATPase [Candidatus Limivicinus sp.]|nr:AAA family ATPase [Candidatus Limivicinus sp.]
MNDYKFGNLIYTLRTQAGFSQSQLGERLGVSNKAVSKWETGKAKPTTDCIRKISALFGISVEELLTARDEKPIPEITKIVITGGPSAGKTTAMSWVQNCFTELGYDVLFVPETASELISGGVAPWNCASNLEFQRCQMRLQIEKERVFEQAARSMKKEKVLIVCDRGCMDNKAYMDSLDFACLLSELGVSEVELRDSYDAVFHLVTAAKGAESFYTTENNKARTETVEQAAALDDKLIAAWTGHPHLRVIDNSTGFEEKMRRLLAEISSFLGEPEPYEIERKFLIEYPDLNWLARQPNCRRVEIIQTYLNAPEGDEVRVRQRGAEGSYIYFQTTKRRVSEVKRVEIEKRLTKDEYLCLLMQADTTKRQIRKDRYCLTYDNQYFEIDIYPFWDDKAIMEIELRDENEQIHFPGQLKVIREVTDDDNYKNASLAAIKVTAG